MDFVILAALWAAPGVVFAYTLFLARDIRNLRKALTEEREARWLVEKQMWATMKAIREEVAEALRNGVVQKVVTKVVENPTYGSLMRRLEEIEGRMEKAIFLEELHFATPDSDLNKALRRVDAYTSTVNKLSDQVYALLNPGDTVKKATRRPKPK